MVCNSCIWQPTALWGGCMSVAKRKTVTSKKDVQERRGRRHRYLRGSSIGHFDSNENAADVIGLLHEREREDLDTRRLSFDLTMCD